MSKKPITTPTELRALPSKIKRQEGLLREAVKAREATEQTIARQTASTLIKAWRDGHNGITATNPETRREVGVLALAENPELAELQKLLVAQVDTETATRSELDRLKALQTNLRDQVRWDTARLNAARTK